jgi:thymidine phosphorylase
MGELSALSPAALAAECLVFVAMISGRGLDVFRKMVERQGGDPRVVDDPAVLPAAPHRESVTADRGGYVVMLDAEAIGRAAMVLGAGRNRAEDAVDPAVGAVVCVRVGDQVREGDALVELHYRDGGKLAAARELIRSACVLADERPTAQTLVLEVIGE